MFVSKNTRAGASSFISNFNSTVRTTAGNGHPDIYDYRDSFDALASTRGPMRATTPTPTRTATARANRSTGLGGAKVADDYAELYNGNWDSYVRVWEDGAPVPAAER